jgi:amino-acid N-acetyltransferase
MSLATLRAATARDAQAIRMLLESSGLPTSDLSGSEPQFIVVCDGEQIIGTGALERRSTVALLRSVAVASTRRGCGIGRTIVLDLERRALALHIRQLILLTQTAGLFFEHQGYRAIDRQTVPPEVQASEEFRVLCPASAICMAKTLYEPTTPHGSQHG